VVLFVAALVLCTVGVSALLKDKDNYLKYREFYEEEESFDVLFFGGSLSTRGLSFFEKMAVRSMRSALYEESIDNGDYSAPSLPGILPENIDKLATEFRRALALAQKETRQG